MTATPKRTANIDTYNYFGDPIYTYSLKTGIDDGFLAPYRVQRVVPSVDATGWRPAPGERDRLGREIPDGWYGTKDYERFISLFSRTQAVAKHLTQYLRLLALGMFALLIIVNLPLFGGLSPARVLSDQQALIIQDGLLLKGSGPTST